MNSVELLNQAFNDFVGAAITKVPNFLAALFILAVAFGARAIIHRTAHVVLTRKTRRRVLAARILETTLLVIGIIVALSLLGISPTGLLTGLGLATVGLSFALQDLIVNFVAGLELLGQAPFELGDEITVGDVKGKVRHIGSRTTVIESNLGESITVPNRDLLTKPVKVTRRP